VIQQAGMIFRKERMMILIFNPGIVFSEFLINLKGFRLYRLYGQSKIGMDWVAILEGGGLWNRIGEQ
jgi:hypothetical protein